MEDSRDQSGGERSTSAGDGTVFRCKQLPGQRERARRHSGGRHLHGEITEASGRKRRAVLRGARSVL